MTQKIITTTIAMFLLSLSTICNGQEKENEPETILTSPDDWGIEVIPFPLGFAPSIDMVGIEDIRFAPGWPDSTHQNFWTYSFAWYIDTYGAMTEDKLTKFFNAYYDGLNDIDHHNRQDTAKVNQMPKTVSLFVKTEEGFTGKMYTYDRFTTKAYFTLNVKVTEQFCTKTKKQIVRCDISPRPIDHKVWEIFKNVKIKEVCE